MKNPGEDYMRNCADCKFATQIAEHEFECNADQYDIDNKTCFVPHGIGDADETAFKDINRILANMDMLTELLT